MAFVSFAGASIWAGVSFESFESFVTVVRIVRKKYKNEYMTLYCTLE